MCVWKATGKADLVNHVARLGRPAEKRPPMQLRRLHTQGATQDRTNRAPRWTFPGKIPRGNGGCSVELPFDYGRVMGFMLDYKLV